MKLSFSSKLLTVGHCRARVSLNSTIGLEKVYLRVLRHYFSHQLRYILGKKTNLATVLVQLISIPFTTPVERRHCVLVQMDGKLQMNP